MTKAHEAFLAKVREKAISAETDYHNRLTGGNGRDVELKVTDFRVPFFSWYRNVVDYK